MNVTMTLVTTGENASTQLVRTNVNAPRDGKDTTAKKASIDIPYIQERFGDVDTFLTCIFPLHMRTMWRYRYMSSMYDILYIQERRGDVDTFLSCMTSNT